MPAWAGWQLRSSILDGNWFNQTSRPDAFRKLALPCQRVGDDGLQIVKARLPSERGTDSVTGGHELCRVARPPQCELDAADVAGAAGNQDRHVVSPFE
jgi:hypothetical protein